MSIKQAFVDGLIFLLKVILVGLDQLLQSAMAAYKALVRSPKQSIPVDKKTVVIVGGNFSGLAARWKLLQHADRFRIVVIDQKEFFEYTPGVLRLFGEPDHFSNIAKRVPGDELGPSSFFIQGKVTSIENEQGQKVLTYQHRNETKTLPYDYLILATGSTYNYPISASSSEFSLGERRTGWEKASQRLGAASNILILGGGAVGVELAAEIVDFFPNKQVTLVDASPTLVPLFPIKVGAYAAQWLTNHGVKLLLGKFLDSWDERSCKLRDGTVLKADMVYVCFGDRPNSQYAPASAQYNQRRNIIVEDTLQVSGKGARGDVFACGDVATPPTEANKQAFHAEVQGQLAAMNVIRKDGRLRLLTYPDGIAHASKMPLIFILSLGRYDGVLGLNDLVMSGPITAVLKWGLEFTKVMQMQGKPMGRIIWSLADEVVLYISRTLIKPNVQSSTVLKTKTG